MCSPSPRTQLLPTRTLDRSTHCSSENLGALGTCRLLAQWETRNQARGASRAHRDPLSTSARVYPSLLSLIHFFRPAHLALGVWMVVTDGFTTPCSYVSLPTFPSLSTHLPLEHAESTSPLRVRALPMRGPPCTGRSRREQV